MQLEKCLLHIKILKLFIFFGGFSTLIVFLIYSLSNSETNSIRKFNQVHLSPKSIQIKIAPKQVPTFNVNGYGNDEIKKSLVYRSREKIKRLSLVGPKNGDPVHMLKLPKHSMQNIHIFYTIPAKWYHSNDDSVLSIIDSIANRAHHKQPNIVFYPMLGLYVPDNKTLQHHLKNIELLGSAVLIITWSPPFQKYLLKQLFDEVKYFNLKIAIEIDDYPNRTAYSLLNDIEYFHREFWHHESLYKVLVASKNLQLPMFYIKNVATLTVSDWSSLFSPNGIISIRGSPQDATFIGHIR